MYAHINSSAKGMSMVFPHQLDEVSLVHLISLELHTLEDIGSGVCCVLVYK